MLNRRWTQPGGLHGDLGGMLSLAFVDFVKRPYKSDMKPFNDIFTAKNLTMTLLKAAIIPANSLMMEYNQYAIEQQQKDSDDDLEEFDWSNATSRHLQVFWPSLLRVSAVTLIRKLYEEYALMTMSARMVDRLTKDVFKSTMRKCQRYSRWVVSREIVRTAFWSNVLFNVSQFTYDVLLKVYEEVRACLKCGEDARPVLDRMMNLVVFTVKKGVFYAACNSFGALGHGVGTYINVTYGGVLGACTFELLAALACSSLLQI